MVSVLDNSRKHWFHEDKPAEIANTMTMEVVQDFKINAENGKDFFSARMDDILVFHSSGNYIEIYWLENQITRKTLFRQSFIFIEQYLKENSQFQKCHRCWMVNLKMINSITGNSKGYYIELNKLGFNIPVSRNYIVAIRSLVSFQTKWIFRQFSKNYIPIRPPNLSPSSQNCAFLPILCKINHIFFPNLYSHYYCSRFQKCRFRKSLHCTNVFLIHIFISKF